VFSGPTVFHVTSGARYKAQHRVRPFSVLLTFTGVLYSEILNEADSFWDAVRNIANEIEQEVRSVSWKYCSA